MDSRTTNLKKNTSILTFGTICTKGIMFIMTPLFTRWLSTSDYGIFDLMTTYVTILLPIITLASGEALFRFILDENDKVRKKIIISTVFCITILGLLIALICCMVWSLCSESNGKLIICFYCYLATDVIYNFFIMLLRGEKKLNAYTLGNIAFVIAMALSVTLLVKVFNFGIEGILLGYACGYLFSIIIMFIYSQIYIDVNIYLFSKDMLRELLRYSIPMIPNAIAWWIINVSDRTLIVLVLGTELSAIYAISNKVPALCTTFFNVFHLSWQQSATESMNDVDRDMFYNSVMNEMLKIVSSICILVLGINFWFFKFLFAEEYFNGVYFSPILIIALIFSMLGQFVGGIYVAQKKSSKNGVTTAVSAAINIVVNILLIESLGLFAASLSTLIAYFALFFIRFVDVKKEISLKFSRGTVGTAILLAYFFAAAYILDSKFQFINLIFALVCFVIINRKYIISILKCLHLSICSKCD